MIRKCTFYFSSGIKAGVFGAMLLIVSTLPSTLWAQSPQVPIDSVMSQRGLNLGELIQGQAAGVQIKNSNGAPGAAFDVIIRGLLSLRGSYQPLYIIDGVMLSDPHLDAPNPLKTLDPLDYQQVQNALRGLNAQDIESIDILQDASATALYGNRGANGVVIVTTKSGNESYRDIVVSMAGGVSAASKQIDMLSSSQYLNYLASKGADPGNLGSLQAADWQDMLARTALTSDVNVAVRGTIKKFRYYTSLYYSNHQGVVKKTGTQDAGFRINIDQTANKIFNYGFRLMIANSSTDMTKTASYAGSGGLIERLTAVPFSGVGENPMSWIDGYDDNTKAWRILPSFYANANITPNLSLRIDGGLDYSTKERLRWLGPEIDWSADLGSVAARSSIYSIYYNTSAGIYYDKQFAGKHGVKASLKGAWYGDTYLSTRYGGNNFFNTTLRAKGIAMAATQWDVNYSKSSKDVLEATAQASYSYGEIVHIGVGVNANTVQRFDKGMRYSPLANAKIEIGNTGAWKSLPLARVFNKLTLFGGWGKSSTDYISPMEDYSYYNLDYSQYDTNGDMLFPINIPYDRLLSYNVRSLTVLDEWNVGLDLGFLSDRITVGAKYYDGKSTNTLYLYNTPVEKHTKTRAEYSNAMRFSRKGFELSAGAAIIQKGDFRWSLNANIARNRSEIIETGRPSNLGDTRYDGFYGRSAGMTGGETYYVNAFIKNQPIGMLYGYKTAGVVGTQNLNMADPVKVSQVYPGDTPDMYLTNLEGDLLRIPQLGDVLLLDTNGDNIVDEQDMTIIGDPNPKFTYGINTSFSYKRFTLSARFDGCYGNDVFNFNLLTQNYTGPTTGTYPNNVRKEAYTQSWTPSGSSRDPYPKLNGFGMDRLTDRMLEDGSYFRLNALTLAYEIPLPKADWIKSFTVNFMATNLFVLTNYSGYNPDVNSFVGDWALRGVDSGSYLSMRTFTLGLLANF